MAAHLVPRWLPNAISVLRGLLVPVWVLIAEAANRAAEGEADGARERIWATVVLLTIGLSDVVDGWLARRFHLQSHIGETIDAIADKLAQVVLFTYLTLRTGLAFPPVPVWFLALLIARDLIILLGYVTIRHRHGTVNAEHRFHGKASSVLLFVLLVAYCAGVPDHTRIPLLTASTVLFTLSTALYVRHGIRQFVRK